MTKRELAETIKGWKPGAHVTVEAGEPFHWWQKTFWIRARAPVGLHPFPKLLRTITTWSHLTDLCCARGRASAAAKVKRFQRWIDELYNSKQEAMP